ncbi:MAG: hypothetical protein HGA94_02210 [Candidatus Aminicenantes bacterium]|nr:hypothetical protein [Candidatus Aminicenantes bacterium]
MAKKLLGIGLLLLGVVSVAPLSAQFLPEEIAQRDGWEEFMLTAEIVKSEKIGQGVTKPWKLFLKRGDVERAGAWKNIDKRIPTGGRDSWRYEIAAYRLDKLIGLGMVPPAVEKAFRGKAGALSLWAESKYNLLEIVEQGVKIPVSAQKHLDDMGFVYRLWGSLIANDDPTQENIRYTEDWRMILIDHSRAFRTDKEYATRLVFGVNGIKRYQATGQPYLIRRVPRDLLERIKALDAAAIKQAVGPYLTDKEIQAVAARVRLIEGEMAEMIKQHGEGTVLY